MREEAKQVLAAPVTGAIIPVNATGCGTGAATRFSADPSRKTIPVICLPDRSSVPASFSPIFRDLPGEYPVNH